MANNQTFTLQELLNHLLSVLPENLYVELQGADQSLQIRAMATLQTAQADEISFLANPNYRKYLASSDAAAVILHPNEVEHFSGPKIVCAQPYIAFAVLTSLFKRSPAQSQGVHSSAVVDASAEVDNSAWVGPNCVVQAGAQIGANSCLEAGVFIGEDVHIGQDCRLHSNVSIEAAVCMGDRVEIHNNTVIGSEGFGFAPTGEGWLKVHQLGSVLIGDDVEIGASTTIDRGALDNTVISDGVKIDNQVQIAHNVRIGEHSAIAACVGISGSAVIGKHCTLAGGVGLVGHIELADKVHITGMTMVTKSITEAGSYSSGTPMMPTEKWRRSAVRFSQLDKLAGTVRTLNKDK
ncbi:UDP-3-O-(3-hydroxymyristoyl)glucosamine N-acyltransferase [uncultured Pseudoteredinibacter sp.]|uniref:UDP-3-O-(3-hydroxymyristoyl)glucosamine N-acyltransferase n=1 Tax=uncultured Pseudoteredinibacter sp. TaxID=1641701 RepID=UPI0026230E60|nr:UDP-3-O-(3-hydroxymyristoyl)glucosamine N-acyltransferase [uncultured Pseudoteredinibacter sp.]